MNGLLQSATRFVKRNSSTILTCIGAAGVVATTVVAVKATPKAIGLLDKAKEEKGEDLTVIEKLKVAGPAYIPAAVVGVSTIACIFGANALNKRSQASIMSAYALLDNAHKEYKKKVTELYGDDADERIRAEIARGRAVPTELVLSGEKKLFLDFYSLQYFESTMEEVLMAENEINRIIHTTGAANVNQFYELLGIPPVSEYLNLGWSVGKLEETHWSSWVEFSHDTVTLDDGLECHIVSMDTEPIMGYLDY